MICRMLLRFPEMPARLLAGRLAAVLFSLATITAAAPAFGQAGGAGLGAQAVGGISIDADGIIQCACPITWTLRRLTLPSSLLSLPS